MIKRPKGGGLLMASYFLIACCIGHVRGQLNSEYDCPPQEKILPCRCSTRDMEVQIWCSHSELAKVLQGLKSVSHYIDRPVDELILENNNLPSLPGKVFASLRVLRLMLRNNRLERVSSGWLEGLDDSLLELFIVEPDLRSLPIDSLESLQGLEAVTVQSRVMKRLPRFSGLPKLGYIQINSPALIELAGRNFRDLSSLQELHVFGSPRLIRLEAGFLQGLPKLELINITDSGLHWIHPRAMVDLPKLKEVSFVGNSIVDAAMIGRACMDLQSLAVIRIDRNRINRIGEGAFTDLALLSRLYLSRNHITELFAGAFQRVPSLKTLDLNHNRIHRINPEFFSRNGLEEIWLINNDLSHFGQLAAVIEALPRLKFIDASHNQLQEIPFAALRGHATLERLHLDHNRLAFIQRESFTGMPALRELRLKNNSLSNLFEGPFWNLPALKGLDISNNYFRHVEPLLLKNLPNLRRLDMSGNAIALIEPESFMETPALEHVNISGNALSVLHPMTFRHLTNLYELDVGWNRMLEVVPGLPKNLEHLHMPMNRIVALPPPATSQDLALPVLRSLDLSANGIERIPPGRLIDLPNLRKLNLGYNSLRILEDGIFNGLARLDQLDLKYNRLVTLHGTSFRPVRTLMDLNLRGNRLEVLRPDIFHDNFRLQRLDISRNNLAQIPHATFATTRDLRELYASHNTLTELPGSLHGLKALQVLDLSFNKLNILSPETLSSLSALLELKLVRNRIRELREGAFDGLPRLSLIDLENNDLRVIERNAIRALPELQAVRLGKNRLQMIPSGAFSELPLLQSAELQENRIQEIASNAFINVPHLLFLNLSHNHLPALDYVGLESLRSLEVLDLSNNRLSRVDSDSLASMEWLVELKMDNNRICAIHGSPFNEMPRLRVLSLRSNRMASVSENAFKRLRSNIAVLDIDGNPLSCSCGMLWLRGWLQQASTDGPRCADGSLFKEIRLSRQDCQRDRQINNPIYPGCEAQLFIESATTSPILSSIFGATEIVPLRMNLKDHSSSSTQIRNISDYLYDEYTTNSGYHQDNPSTLAPIISMPTQTDLAAVQLSEYEKKNGTALPLTTPQPQPGKKNYPSSPPSPSSSGFTFFGVPLPNLNFNLWGNSGRKTERKDSSLSFSAGRPGRGRYRTFPLTEPEIHRGGFIPLPRGQGGFVPITDPSLTVYEKQQFKNLTTTTFDDSRPTENQSNATSSTSGAVEERKRSGNGTIVKLEKTNRPASQRFKDREELSTIVVNNQHDFLYSPKVFNTTKIPKKELNTTSTTYHEFDLDESKVNERSGPAVEVASRIVWTTTPKTAAAPAAAAATTTTTTTTTSQPETDNDFTPIPKSTAKNTFWDVEPEKISKTFNNFQRVSPITIGSDVTTTPSSTENRARKNSSSTYKLSRETETASALSALLIPGGQITSTSNNPRTLGRSTITKVPSPHFRLSAEQEKRNSVGKQSPDRVFQNGITIQEEETLQEDANVLDIQDGAFNWYFQHYNDTNSVEPFVGSVLLYSGNSKPSASQWFILLTQFYLVLLAA